MQTISDGDTHVENVRKIGLENLRELQKLQDKFSSISRLFLYCVDKDGKTLTEVSGGAHGADVLFSQIDKRYFETAFQEVTADRTQEQIVDATNIPGVMVAAQSVSAQDGICVVWLLFAVVEEAVQSVPSGVSWIVTEEELYNALDFLHAFSRRLIKLGGGSCLEQSAEVAALLEQKVSAERNFALLETVRQLESESSAELIFENILRITGEFLKISSAQVFRIHDDLMDVVAEWHAEGIISLFDQTRNLKKMLILQGSEPIVVKSLSELSQTECAQLSAMHVKSVIIMPVLTKDKTELYLCFNECIHKRSWSEQDILLIENAARIIQNVLLRKRQQTSLESSYAALKSILDHAGSAIYVTDRETGKVLFANRVLKRIFHAELEENSFQEMLSKAIEKGRQSSGSYELFHFAKGHWYDMYSTSIRWVNGHTALLYALYDITDKKVYQKKIEQQAYTDFLTGLYNRMCCERDLAIQIDEAKSKGGMGALLYLDLDDFKHINEGLGHQYGDILLKAISHSFQHIPEIDNNCYRVGGDEFIIIILPKYYQRFNEIIEEIKEVFSKPWFLRDGDYYCTMSMGVVKFPEAGENVQELIKKADIAMYEAKKGGKNRVAFYSDTIKSLSGRRLDMEKNMRDATVEGYQEFEVYYQPIIVVDHEGDNHACCGAEALIRWNSSELGFISPADFIPLAEYLGLINPIGGHVLLEACRECKKWNDSGYPDYKVNVNLSVVQLLQPDIVESIKSALEETGIKPHNLTLEVTESLAINDMERMKQIIGSIRMLGAQIALDDFGTGYSSLNHIRELPLDIIKIDQNFVRNLDKDSYSQAFIRMVTELADAINVKVCVEGIETKEQLDVLCKLPVTTIQGYYFDKPMQAAAFEEKYTPRL